MSGKDFSEVVELIVREDPRYPKPAYYFVRKALDHTLKGLKKKPTGEKGHGHHVSGKELLEGIRDYALKQFGPMSYTLFEKWQLNQTSDFGEIVFNLVEYGIFGKTEHDDIEDFKGVYDFREAFLKPFMPKGNLGTGSASGSNGGKTEKLQEDSPEGRGE